MTREQARVLSDLMQPRVGFIVTVRERMCRAQMDQDPLYKLLLQAAHALRSFTVSLHYRSCESGGGRKSNDDLAQ